MDRSSSATQGTPCPKCRTVLYGSNTCSNPHCSENPNKGTEPVGIGGGGGGGEDTTAAESARPSHPARVSSPPAQSDYSPVDLRAYADFSAFVDKKKGQLFQEYTQEQAQSSAAAPRVASLHKMRRKQEEIEALRRQLAKVNDGIDARVEKQLQERMASVCVELEAKHESEMTKFAQLQAKAQQTLTAEYTKERHQLHVVTQSASDEASRLRKALKKARADLGALQEKYDMLTQNRNELAALVNGSRTPDDINDAVCEAVAKMRTRHEEMRRDELAKLRAKHEETLRVALDAMRARHEQEVQDAAREFQTAQDEIRLLRANATPKESAARFFDEQKAAVAASKRQVEQQRQELDQARRQQEADMQALTRRAEKAEQLAESLRQALAAEKEAVRNANQKARKAAAGAKKQSEELADIIADQVKMHADTHKVERQRLQTSIREHENTLQLQRDAIMRLQTDKDVLSKRADAYKQIADNMSATVQELNVKLHHGEEDGSSAGAGTGAGGGGDHAHAHAHDEDEDDETESEDEDGETEDEDGEDFVRISKDNMSMIQRVIKAVIGIPSSFVMSMPDMGWAMLAGSVETADQHLEIALDRLNKRMTTLCAVAGIEEGQAPEVDWNKMIEIGFKTIEFSDQAVFGAWSKLYADFAAFAVRVGIEDTEGHCQKTLPLSCKVTTLLAAVETRIPTLLERAALKFDELSKAQAAASKKTAEALAATIKHQTETGNAQELVEQSKLMLQETDALLLDLKRMLSEGDVEGARKLLNTAV